MLFVRKLIWKFVQCQREQISQLKILTYLRLRWAQTDASIISRTKINGSDCELVSLSDCKPDASGTVGSSPTWSTNFRVRLEAGHCLKENAGSIPVSPLRRDAIRLEAGHP